MNNEMMDKVGKAILELSMVALGQFAIKDDEGITCLEIHRKFADTPHHVQDFIMENLIKAGYIKHVEATPESPDCKYVFCGSEEMRKKLIMRELKYAAIELMAKMKSNGN